MTERVRVSRKWVFERKGPVDSVSVASVTGDVVIGDLSNKITLVDNMGKMVWENKSETAPLKLKLTESGEFLYILTVDGFLLKINRKAEMEWSLWTEKKPLALALKANGQSAVVASYLARFHVVNGIGKRIRLVHTPEPIVYARYSSKTGGLFVASARGWIGLYDKHYKPRRQYNLNTAISQLEVSEKGRKVFCPARDNGLQVVEVEDSQLATYTPGFPVTNVGIDRKGDHIIVTSLDGDVALLDSAGKLMWKTKTDNSWIHCEMTHKGDRFVLVSDKGVVAYYKISYGRDTMDTTSRSHLDFLEV